MQQCTLAEVTEEESETLRQLGQDNMQAESSGAAVQAALVVLLVAEGMLPMLTDRQLVLGSQQRSLQR